MEKDFCEKCENYGWVEKHHVLPKCEFGDDGELVKLCPNSYRLSSKTWTKKFKK